MAKTSTLIVTGTKEPRQKMWEAMRHLRPGFTVNDIARQSCGRSADISRYIQALIKAGVVKLVEAPQGATTSRGKVFALVRDEGADHPRLNNKGERTFDHLATENIWRTLRILGGQLTVQDIAQTASAGAVSVSVVKVRQYLNALADAGYPVGSVYMNMSSNQNPAALFGFGTWLALAPGRVLLGAGSGTDSRGETKAFSAGSIGGEFNHQLAMDEIPAHSHTTPQGATVPASGGSYQYASGDDVTTSTMSNPPLSGETGGGQAHNNMQPYLVAYMWKRTA